MKKILFISILVLQSVIAIGQELKTKKKKVYEREGRAIFYVLASNDTIMHGKYQIKAYTGNRILLSGTYNNNEKVGLWIEQYYGKKYNGPKASGQYINNKKTGCWIYFDYEGDTSQIYDYTENRVVFSNHYYTDTIKYAVIKDGIEDLQKLDYPPICETGTEYFLYQFTSDIGEKAAKYFKIHDDGWHLLESQISVTIDDKSSITEISYSTDENEELKRIIEKYINSYKWISGSKDEKFITSKFVFTIHIGSRF